MKELSEVVGMRKNSALTAKNVNATIQFWKSTIPMSVLVKGTDVMDLLISKFPFFQLYVPLFWPCFSSRQFHAKKNTAIIWRNLYFTKKILERNITVDSIVVFNINF